MTTFETNVINQMTEKLKKLGVDVHVAHYTGDSSYPTEYTISYQGISAVGPTFDLALLEWIEKLIEVAMKPASSYQAMDAALRALAGSIFSLRTDLLVVKDVVVKDSEEK
jgi:hypothetical protein